MTPWEFGDRGFRNASIAIFILVALYTWRGIFEASEGDLNDGRRGFLPLTLSDRPKPGQNVAVMIETRPLLHVVPLLLHFSNVLGPEWPIYLFTTQTRIPKIRSLRRMISTRRIIISSLPQGVTFENRNDVSDFLTKPWLYNRLAPAGHMLIFQPDSIICAQSPLRVEDFLKYDYVGAPIDKKYGVGFNGGFSLRNRDVFLQIALRSSWKEEVDEATMKNQGGVPEYEDQWFYKKLLEYPGASLPDQETASTFAVETVWQERPLGYHQVMRWHRDKVKEIDAWCPEHILASAPELIG